MHKLIQLALLFSIISCSSKKSINQNTVIKAKGDFYCASFFNKTSGDTLYKIMIDYESETIEVFQSGKVPIGIQLEKIEHSEEHFFNIHLCKLTQLNGGSYKASFSKKTEFTKPKNVCEEFFQNYTVGYTLKKGHRILFKRNIIPDRSEYKLNLELYEDWFDLGNLSFTICTNDVNGLKIISSD